MCQEFQVSKTHCGYKYLKGKVKRDSYEWGKNTNMNSSQQLLQGWLAKALEVYIKRY